MPAPSESDLQLEIGHVLLIDIVGYSKLLITEQRERLQALNEIVRNTAQFRASDANGMLVRIPTGDGMALIFRDNLEAPARCAFEISQALRPHPEVRLRDRKSTRLNSSHGYISYAVFCLKKKIRS